MLARIVAEKQKQLEAQKTEVPLKELQAMAKDAGPIRSFRDALQLPGLSLIAEVKYASPSKGEFGVTAPAVAVAEQYAHGGANAISVLTETMFFHGKNQYLLDIRKHVPLPVLRKDFIIDLYQIYESRCLCADAILLIARLLTGEQLTDFIRLAVGLGMDVLVETHDAFEIETALACGANIIGMNNRNLETFRTHIDQTLQLAPNIPDHILKVSESGIRTGYDLQQIAAAGVDAVLIGEALVTAKDPVLKIQQLWEGTAL